MPDKTNRSRRDFDPDCITSELYALKGIGDILEALSYQGDLQVESEDILFSLALWQKELIYRIDHALRRDDGTLKRTEAQSQ